MQPQERSFGVVFFKYLYRYTQEIRKLWANVPTVEVYIMKIKDLLTDLPKIIFITYVPMK